MTVIRYFVVVLNTCSSNFLLFRVKKEESEAKLSRLSILPLSESKTKNLNVHSSEKLALLPNTKNLSRPSTPEKLSIPSSEENLIRPSRYKKSFRAPSITVLLKSPKPKKPRKARLEKACKPAPPHKQAAQAGSSSAVKPVRAPSLTSLQSPGKPAKLSYPENQVLPPMSPSLKKLAKPPKHHNLKMSKSVGEAGTVFTPPSATTCQYYKERCLVCKTSECLLNSTSKEKKENTGYLPVSGEMMPLSRSFHKVDSCNHAYFANMSNGDMIDESNDDSDREITMFCNLTSRDIFPKGTPK